MAKHKHRWQFAKRAYKNGKTCTCGVEEGGGWYLLFVCTCGSKKVVKEVGDE